MNKNYLISRKLTPYEILDQNYAKWTRINSDSINVSTQGYCNENCIMLENELKAVQVYATKRQYNQFSGETVTTYKLKGNRK
jgi:phosphatidate phosphatase APP1